jgi:Zn-dependent oligopeptidase
VDDEVAVGQRAWAEPPLDLPTPAAAEISGLTNAAMQRADRRIDAAISAVNTDATGGATTFESLFGALDDAAREVAIAFGRGAAQYATAADDDVRAAAFAANEEIEKWRAGLPLRKDLAAVVDRFAMRADLGSLDDAERRYVERWRKDIRLAGGDLPAKAREEMARLTNRLLELGSAFRLNLAKAPHVRVRREELEGLPDSLRSAATPLSGDPETLDLEINDGAYLAIMERSPRRTFRERVYRTWTTRGVPDNLALLEEAITARRRIAAIAGYPSWQAYRAENLAAPDGAFINAFIEDVATRIQPVVEREVAAMEAVLRTEPGAPADLRLQDWDWRYADAIQRRELGVDQERLSEHFELGRVLDGLATLSAQVFGIRLDAHPERIGWDPAVRPFDLVDAATGRLLAHLFVDPWSRPGKQAGAWMEILFPGGGRHDEARPPTLSLVLNVPPPGDGPALLRAVEVETLFHEYGHVMNAACGANRFVAHRSQWLPFDFIEGPSEFNGRWGLRPPVVARYACHYQTGEAIPPDLVNALVRSEALNAAFQLQRILSLGRFDALVHGPAPISIEDATRAAWSIRGLPFVEGTSQPASLDHILGGAYDAALYGYAWSEVIRDDLLERFEGGGLTSPAMGAAYRRDILAVSWYDDPVAAVNAFLGRAWSVDAFLRRAAG